MATKTSDFTYDVTTYLSSNYIRMAGYHKMPMRRERLESWINEITFIVSYNGSTVATCENTFIVSTADMIDEAIKNDGYFKAKDSHGNRVTITAVGGDGLSANEKEEIK